MAEGEERIELKFRIFDGTDIAHSTYALSTAVATLKQRLVAEWPQGFWLVYLYIFLVLHVPLYATDFDQYDFNISDLNCST